MGAPLSYQKWPNFTLHLSAAAAADYDGAGSTAGCTGTANGPIDFLGLIVTPKDTTTAGNLLRVFFDDGTNKVPLGDFTIPQQTKQATNPNWRLAIPWTPPRGVIPLNGTSEKIRVSEEKGDDLEILMLRGAYQNPE